MAMYTDEEFFEVLNKLIDLQLADIEKSLSAEADVLCLVGCMNLIEFLGGIRNGKLGKKGAAENRFKEGVRLLGDRWTNENLMGENTMWNLRNALVHQYIPEATESDIGIFHILGSHTIRFIDYHAIRPPHFKTGGRIPKSTQIWIEKLINDLKDSREKLIHELTENDDIRNKLIMTLWWLPKLQE